MSSWIVVLAWVSLSLLVSGPAIAACVQWLEVTLVDGSLTDVSN